MALALADRKAALRQTAQLQRRAASAAAPAAGEAVCALVLERIPIPAGAAVSGYWPMRSELDCRPLLYALHGRGHPVGLPVIIGKGQPLVFRSWHPGLAMVAGGFGTEVPDQDCPEITPAALFVPLLAFDRQGFRLGYGGGFYDRTLDRLRSARRASKGDAAPPLAIGVALAGQEVAAVPRDHSDQRLDWIVTEADAIRVAP